MKRRNTICLVGLLSLLGAMVAATPAFAQVDPTELGGGKKAYVLLIIDSSASMEFNTVGDNEFPKTDYNFGGIYDLYPGFNAVTWQPGTAMDAANALGFGSCFIYSPDTYSAPGDSCNDYGRPGWRTSTSGWSIASPTSLWDAQSPSNAGVVGMMRGDYARTEDCGTGLPGLPACGGFGPGGWRLQDATQPRHVTIKEVLTGNMIMLPTDAPSFEPEYYPAHSFGPGCWFIPRQRDASSQPIEDQTYCAGEGEFEDVPDFDQPLPHFQEVFDVQQATGVLDTLGTTALFAVAAFDSFREKLDPQWDGFNDVLDDEMDGTYPSDSSSIRGPFQNEDSEDCDENGIDDDDCYNLGIWQVIGPTDLQIPATLLPELSAYTQIAINDTGFLRDDNDDEFTLTVDSKKSGDNAFLGATFSKSFKNYANDIELGRQPIARATPIAAAIHDVYQFMSHGQDGDDPINDDLFRECRPKHVVMLTDGQPEPERSPIGDGTSDTLNLAFGYDVTRYTYDTAENEIAQFVNDVDGSMFPANGEPTPVLDKYNPRVHVFGLNLDTDDQAAIAKMAGMAIEGRSCAQALVPELVPFGTSYDAGGGTMEVGTCLTGCLVPQTAAVAAHMGGVGYVWTHPQSEEQYVCNDFPALILDDNDPQKLAAALSSFMSALVDTSGLTSRTRLVVSNRLDDVSIGGGGQYRVYSGVRVGGGSAWWGGVLNRNTIRCDDVPGDPPATPELSLDHEVATQVSIAAGVRQDSRRVWTAIPKDTIWDFTTRVPAAIATGNAAYPMQYDLQEVADGLDEFQGTYLTTGVGDVMLLGTRVPFESAALEDAIPAPLDPYGEYGVVDRDGLDKVVNVYRARIPQRISAARGGNIPSTSTGVERDRVVGGILNSNPLVVGPPNQDLPIASYREFRARYADRQTMMYVNSMDGLLHALHLGDLANSIKVRQPTAANVVPGPDTTTCAPAPCRAGNQREAWAYMPWMVHRRLSSFQSAQAYLMDGSPVAKDVRLCGQTGDNNTNTQACKSVCPAAGCTVAGMDQWRTVLVQGAGAAASGYYAMDITRPGGVQLERSGTALNVENPDPILLWEFDREWERAQLEYFYDAPGTQKARISSAGVSPENTYYGSECGSDLDELWRSPLMGLSVSEPEIATVIVDGQQRPIAVFGGGSKDPENTLCGGQASGMAIYVVDLQTGSLLRRFTDYDDLLGVATSFMSAEPSRFVGSPALYDSSSGSVATRGFIGDDLGRLFKIDFLNPDPDLWSVSLFFDPYNEPGLPGGVTWGPAAFKPAIALNPQRDVVVVYGLGETGDVVTNGQAQAIIAVTENRATPDTGSITWAEVFPEGEKVTGAPIVFDANVYFPTYKIDVNAICDPGNARIWGVSLVDLDPVGIATVGVFGGNPDLAGPPMGIDIDPTSPPKWYGPTEPTLIRGLTVTLGKICSADDIGTDNPTYSTGDRPQPELIAQTSGPVDSDLDNPDESATPVSDNALSRIGLRLERPASQTIPLSWSQLF